MKVEHRVLLDTICDYIPVVSTFNSIVDLWQKHAFKDGPDTNVMNTKYWDAYSIKIKTKSTLRSVILLVPFLGNLCVALYDLCKGLSQRF